MAEVLIADNRTPRRSGYWFCAHSFHGDIHRRHLICWHPGPALIQRRLSVRRIHHPPLEYCLRPPNSLSSIQ
jgi:hypothetical protein